eukprot:6178382-Pleurochrysis_carterae.AAC.1
MHIFLYEHPSKSVKHRYELPFRVTRVTSVIRLVTSLVLFECKATVTQKQKLNEVLRSYSQDWSFSERKRQRDTRPSGNKSRTLLALPGLLCEMLCVRYGGRSDANDDDMDTLDRLSAAQSAGAPQIDPSACSAAGGVGKKRKQRFEVTSAGSSSMRRPPPLPPPQLSTPALPSTAARPPAAADEVVFDCDEDDDYTARLTQKRAARLMIFCRMLARSVRLRVFPQRK